jgi:hypothetical protein
MDIGVLKLSDVNLDKGIISDHRHKTGTLINGGVKLSHLAEQKCTT